MPGNLRYTFFQTHKFFRILAVQAFHKARHQLLTHTLKAEKEKRQVAGGCLITQTIINTNLHTHAYNICL